MKEKYYVVLRLHKDDIRSEFEGQLDIQKKIDKMTDAQMKNLARKIGEACCENGTYWDAIRDEFEVKK
jgi:hypothetical protein